MMPFHRLYRVLQNALLTFFSNLPTNGGEDVANARNNAFSDYPIDFWGGVSSFFYSAAAR